MSLTDTALRALKPRDKPFKVWDGKGLYVLVHPNGGRYFRLNYIFNGRQMTLALGVYPLVTLAEAREARDNARKLLARKVDPARQRHHEKLERRRDETARRNAERNTFQAVAEEWREKERRAQRAPRTLERAESLLRLHLYPTLGQRPIGEITRVELLDVLRKVNAKGRKAGDAHKGYLETIKRLRSVVGRVYRYAITFELVDHDITADLRGAFAAPRPEHHAAILKPAAIGELLRAIDGYTGSPIVRAALQMMALTFPRPGELRHAEWREFDLHAAEPVWRIPAVRTKMRRDHLVPLAPQAVAVLKALRPWTNGSDLAFASLRGNGKPMSENTMGTALRGLGYGQDQMSAHGFRRIASTLLNEAGHNRDVIERQLGHIEGNSVRAAYNAAEYWPERVVLMQWWADALDRLRAGKPVGRVGDKGHTTAVHKDSSVEALI